MILRYMNGINTNSEERNFYRDNFVTIKSSVVGRIKKGSADFQ